MRLLNIHTLRLIEFVESKIPAYAILSHKWTEEELTFKEVLKERPDTHKRGYSKLLGACRIAANYEVEYIWIDTCCIDKTSSAELSESINSMFTWYQSAKVCVAYLEDVEAGPELDATFRESVWFTRSWTLQELLAPRLVEFYDGHWTHIGDKAANLSALEDITAVSRYALGNPNVMRGCSVVEKMSWAADREATRAEDIAYSLMGIFDVNMPLLYGEGGRKAFRRLQEEIIQRTSDTTVLCWGLYDASTHRLLASSPADFLDFRGLELYSGRMNTEFRITNIGLEIHAEVVRWDLDTFGMLLGEAGEAQDTYTALVRKRPFETTLHRVGIENIEIRRSLAWRKNRKLLILWGNEEQHLEEDSFAHRDTEHGFQIETSDGLRIVPGELKQGSNRRPTRSEMGRITNHPPRMTWEFGDPMLPAVATIALWITEIQICSIDLSFDFDGRPCCLVYHRAPSDLRHVWQISESFPESESSGELQEEHLMLPSQDRTTGITLWFLRSHSNHSSTFARVPAVITGQDKEAWICFYPPHLSRGARSTFWTFRITKKPPLFDRNGPLPL